ncbi:MAG: TIGR03663 family protein [Anaerolineales bacterium]|nr:TIGR03663 family protein [Anaerolineales bacterium]
MNTEEKRTWLDRFVHPTLPAVTIEVVIFVILIFLTILSRLYGLGERVMSHDESLHTYFSYLLYKGQGYSHSPMMHGPFQFHGLALIYFLFGVSDFTSRIPAALCSIATIWMIWYWRRYLGRTGALLAGILMLISPYLLFYGRYVRNEAYVGLFGILMLYTILRHIETGESKYLYLMTTAVVLHFASKETSFIYIAQALLFLGLYFLANLFAARWDKQENLIGFLGFGLASPILIGGAMGIGLYYQKSENLSLLNPQKALILSIFALGFISLLVAMIYFVRGVRWGAAFRRAFNLLILLGTFTLPQLAPFIVNTINVNSLAYTDQNAMIITGSTLAFLMLVSAGIGLIWNWEEWLKNALIFYGIFTILYTTFFSNGQGFLTGMVGSLGYWLEQQGVARGSQPWYFYLLIQIPLYEFLPALGGLLALGLGFWRSAKQLYNRQVKIRQSLTPGAAPAYEENLTDHLDETPDAETSLELAELASLDELNEQDQGVNLRPPTLPLIAWWIVTSIVAYTYAGEKMPWLTYHISWPMILVTGWALGQLIDTVDWAGLIRRKASLVISLTVVFTAGLFNALYVYNLTPPFQGKELVHLQATATFTLAIIAAIGSAAGLVYLLRDWDFGQVIRITALSFFALLAILTGRTAFRATYIDYDQATEYLVYAHSARGVKDVMNQVYEISQRTTGGMGVSLAYDASAPDTGVSWPFVWYLRDYTNQISFDTPTRNLRERDVIIVDQKNFDKIGPIVGEAYYRFDYTRMWWPNQDYFYLTPERFEKAYQDPNIRAGIIDIWFNRDYTRYAQATGSQNFTLPTWEPSDRMRLYIKKDIAEKMWNYGLSPAAETTFEADPYELGAIALSANLTFGSTGTEFGQMNGPRGIAVAPDSSLYVADSRNHRIQHFNADGSFINAWGSYANILDGEIPPGTFNEPWGVAVGPDGSVYVADTWNHRIQKFTEDGKFIAAWGTYGLAETPLSMWGPRDIAVSKDGRLVFVTDAGNKRVVVFTERGEPVTAFGEIGYDPGQFDEPIGIDVDENGIVYVADTWNRRIQSFAPSTDGINYYPLTQWDVAGWYGESLENKPFLVVGNQGQVFITDPELYRVVQFDSQGGFIRAWGNYGIDTSSFGYATGIEVDQDGNIWVTDAGNNRIMHFVLPADGESEVQ